MGVRIAGLSESMAERDNSSVLASVNRLKNASQDRACNESGRMKLYTEAAPRRRIIARREISI